VTVWVAVPMDSTSLRWLPAWLPRPAEPCLNQQLTCHSARPSSLLCCKAGSGLLSWFNFNLGAHFEASLGHAGLTHALYARVAAQACSFNHKMESQQSALDLPLITEATNEFYRQVYANNDLGHIFKVSRSFGLHGSTRVRQSGTPLTLRLCVLQGVNMVVLRRHVSYFILQVSLRCRGGLLRPDQGSLFPLLSSLQLTAFETPMTEPQTDYLRKVRPAWRQTGIVKVLPQKGRLWTPRGHVQ
jgi:hypothetical protein